MSKNKKTCPERGLLNPSRRILVSIICGLIIIIPCFVLAAELKNPIQAKDFQTLIGQVIKAVLGVVGSIALLMFIYGGFLWMTSSGNEQKITQGKNVITWATIGLAIIFLSYTLVNFVIGGITAGGGGGGGGSTTESEAPAGSTLGVCKCTDGYQSIGSTDAACMSYEAIQPGNCNCSGGSLCGDMGKFDKAHCNTGYFAGANCTSCSWSATTLCSWSAGTP